MLIKLRVLKSFWLLLAILFFTPNISYAQDRTLRFEEFVIQDGFASVNCILKDKEGFMWFGGTHGLYRYDGYIFKVFNANDANKSSLSNNNVTSLYEDDEGHIWVGTMQGGVNKYDPIDESFTSYLNEKQSSIFSNLYITTITQDNEGLLWFGTFGNGIYVYDKKSPDKKMVHLSGRKRTISNNDVFSILATDQEVWIATNAGILDRYDKSSGLFSHYKYSNQNYQSARSGQRLCLDSKGNIWIATEEEGVFKFDRIKKTFEHFRHIEGRTSISTNNITDIKEGKPGQIWMTTGQGLNLLDSNSGEIKVYSNNPYDKYSITNNVSYCLFVDEDSSIWMGMGDGTVNRTIHSPFKVFQSSFSKNQNSLSFNVIGSLYMADDTLWIGTGGGGLDRLDLVTNTFSNFKNDPADKASIPSNIVMTVLGDKKNNIWTGNSRESLVSVLKNDAENFYQPQLQIPATEKFVHNLVFDLVEDDRNTIWIATYNQGLYSYDIVTGKFRNYKANQGNSSLPSNKLLSLLYDSSGKLWIGTLDKGIQIYDPLSDRFFSPSKLESIASLPIDYPIKDIFEDNSGTIWIATEGGGVFIFDRQQKKCTQLTTKDGLPSNSIYGIIEDNSGDLWFSTNKGISTYKTKNKKILTYNTNDGLPTNDFESGAIAKDKDDRLFFGSKKGLIAFYPYQLRTSNIPPNLKLTNFRIFNETVDVNEKIDSYIPLDSSIVYTTGIQLPYFLDNFTFEFATPGHPTPYNIKYEYHLDGLDDRWIGTSPEQHYANYSNVPPGSYIFKVRAYDENNIGKSGVIEKQLKILITPIWWQTKFAYFCYALLLGSLLYFIYYNVRKRVRLKNQLIFEKFSHEKDEELHRSKINFFTTISHELRTSLTLILVPLSELVKSKDGNNKTKNLVMTMNRNGQRLFSLINQILDFRKIESGITDLRISETTLIDFFDEASLPFEQLAKEKNLIFKINYSENCNKAWFDPDKIEIIFYNLVSNAIKFADKKVTVFITMTEKMESLQIKVQDDGKGISKENLEKVFKKFYQVENNQDEIKIGTGLGLAITKNLVEIHKGSIDVESQPYQLTEFAVSIPAYRDFYDEENIQLPVTKDFIDAEELQLAAKTIIQNGQEKEAIMLIVDDNNEIRQLIEENFTKQYQVHTAINGQEAYEKALETIPDIIITDIMMPVLNGFELCKKLKTDQRTSHIPIILLTARYSNTYKMGGFEYGADDYITKPFDIELLQSRVNNLIETRKILREKFHKEIFLKPKDIAINNADEAFLEKIMSIIEANISESSFSVSILASEIGMSHSVLYRKMMALTGQNINDFIKSVRLKRAEQLILESNYTINEISDMTGFSNPKYFSTCFKQKFNETPSKFRKSFKNF